MSFECRDNLSLAFWIKLKKGAVQDRVDLVTES